MNEIILSVRPPWCDRTFDHWNGKNYEYRNTSFAKLQLPCKVYVYTTKTPDPHVDGPPYGGPVQCVKGWFVCDWVTGKTALHIAEWAERHRYKKPVILPVLCQFGFKPPRSHLLRKPENEELFDFLRSRP